VLIFKQTSSRRCHMACSSWSGIHHWLTDFCHGIVFLFLSSSFFMDLAVLELYYPLNSLYQHFRTRVNLFLLIFLRNSSATNYP